MSTYRIKTGPGEDDRMSVGSNGLLAAVKAASVAKEDGIVVVLEKYTHLGTTETPSGTRHDWAWVPDEVFFPEPVA